MKEDLILKTLVKSYTSDACFKQVNECIVGGVDEKIQDFLTLLIQQLSSVRDKYAYKEFSKPLFRGVKLSYINIEKDY